MAKKRVKRTVQKRLRRDRDFVSLPVAGLRAIVRRGRLTKGERVGIEVILAIHELKHGGGMTYVVSPKSARAKKSGSVARKASKNPPRHCLKALLKGVSKKNLHPEVRIGRPVGRELL